MSPFVSIAAPLGSENVAASPMPFVKPATPLPASVDTFQ